MAITGTGKDLRIHPQRRAFSALSVGLKTELLCQFASWELTNTRLVGSKNWR